MSERRFPTRPGGRAQGEMRQEWDEGSQRNQRPLSRYSLPEGRLASILNLHDKAPPGDLNAHLAANLKPQPPANRHSTAGREFAVVCHDVPSRYDGFHKADNRLLNAETSKEKLS